ncbi:hypothetical protein MNBD_CPR01-329 [hydrothermal vent metagenome]|uniref:Uncharacterized protein n=1 Tax=hydrothermal vent metagenome TaxID=652676 RepID=A0A3B0V3T7_9ZZZZ
MEYFHVYRLVSNKRSRGFTLIELLIVIAIMGILMSIVINGQNKFGQTTILSSTAYDVALSIRQAQAYGMAGYKSASYGYGIDFSHNTPSEYTLFGDSYPSTISSGTCHNNNPDEPSDAPSVKTGDCLFTPNDSAFERTFTIHNYVEIKDFCVYKSGSGYCTNGGSVIINKLDISFVRPKTSAIIYAKNSSSEIQDADRACIKLSKANGARYVVVEKVGTIAVLQKPGTTCPGL